MLALRFRKATDKDLVFFGKARPRAMAPKATEASDINLSNIQEKKLLQTYVKKEGKDTVKVIHGCSVSACVALLLLSSSRTYALTYRTIHDSTVYNPIQILIHPPRRNG